MAPSYCLAVDFAGHYKRLSGIASEIASMDSKLLATCNLVKITGRQKYPMRMQILRIMRILRILRILQS